MKYAGSEVILCDDPGNGCENKNCKLTRHHIVAQEVGRQAIEAYGLEDPRTSLIRKYIKSNDNVVLTCWPIHTLLQRVATTELSAIPSEGYMQGVVYPNREEMRRPEPSIHREPPNLESGF